MNHSFFNIRIFTISLLCTLLLAFLALYGVHTFAANEAPKTTLNHIDRGGVNVRGLPSKSENKGENEKLYYEINFSSVLVRDGNGRVFVEEKPFKYERTSLFVVIPEDAANPQFRLKWTMMTYGATDIGELSTPAQVDIPLVECSNDCEGLKSINQISSENITELKSLRSDVSTYFPWYKVYRIYGNTENHHPVSLELSFDYPKADYEQYIPIRAFLDTLQSEIFLSWYDGGFTWDQTNPNDENTFIDYQDFMDAEERKPFTMPVMKNIKKTDFDKHGLYRDNTYCAVTRDLSRWYKMGNDIDGNNFSLRNYVDFRSYPHFSIFGVPRIEDLCDQAVVTIPGA